MGEEEEDDKDDDDEMEDDETEYSTYYHWGGIKTNKQKCIKGTIKQKIIHP